MKRMLLWPLVAMALGDISEFPSLLWPLVATVSGDITKCPLLLWSLVAIALGDITECLSLLWPCNSSYTRSLVQVDFKFKFQLFLNFPIYVILATCKGTLIF
jgi:hypothetical protein